MWDAKSIAKRIYFFKLLEEELYNYIRIDGVNDAVNDYLIAYLAHTNFYTKLIDKWTSKIDTKVLPMKSKKEMRTEADTYLNNIFSRFYDSLLSLEMDEDGCKARTIQASVLSCLNTINDFNPNEREELLRMIINSLPQER